MHEPVSGIGQVSQSDKTASYTDWQGNEKTVSRGGVNDLSDLVYFTGLKTLWLQYQSLSSLDTMPACSITSLNLNGSRVADLTGIGKLPELRRISADYNPVGSLGDMNKCHELTHASFIGASCTDLSVFKPLTRIQSVAFSNCSLSDIAQVLDMSSLRSVKPTVSSCAEPSIRPTSMQTSRVLPCCALQAHAACPTGRSSAHLRRSRPCT